MKIREKNGRTYLIGNTYSIKDELKSCGMKFDGNEKAWYGEVPAELIEKYAIVIESDLKSELNAEMKIFVDSVIDHKIEKPVWSDAMKMQDSINQFASLFVDRAIKLNADEYDFLLNVMKDEKTRMLEIHSKNR